MISNFQVFLSLLPLRLLIIFIIILFAIPFKFFTPLPLFIVIVIFYWSIYVPAVLSKWYIVLITVLVDLLQGVPIGVNLLIALGFNLFLMDHRKQLMNKSFSFIWAMASFIIFLYVGMMILILSMLSLKTKTIFDYIIIKQIIITACSYVVFHSFFDKIKTFFLKLDVI